MARNNIYQTLIGKLEKALSGMAEGTLLPSEQELADRFGVSKPTLRRALAELADRKLIEKKNGIGSVVAGSTKVISRELIFLCHDVVFFAESLKRFSAAAADRNYLSSIIPLCGDTGSQERIIATAISRNPAGLVIYPFIPVIGKCLLNAAGIAAAYINLVIREFGSLPFAVIKLGRFAFVCSLALLFSVIWALFACKKRTDMLKLKAVNRKIVKEGGGKLRWR